MTMWCRSVRDDKSGSRGQDGSPSDSDGLGIPSRSAPASPLEILIGKLERGLHEAKALEHALREVRADGDRFELWLNLMLGQVEQATRRWRAESPSSRPQTFFPLGRPPALDEDVLLLRALRSAKPGLDCRAEFTATLLSRGFSKHWVRTRYRAADGAIASASKSLWSF
jgi:hypothetical protein